MNLLGRWRAADDPRRVELYTHWSLVPAVFCAPLLVLGLGVGADASGAWVAAAASLVQAFAVALAVSRVVHRRAWGLPLVVAWVTASALAYVVGLLALRGTTAAAGVATAAAVLSVTPLGRFRFRRYAPVVVVVVGAATAPLTAPPAVAAMFVVYGWILASVLQLSMWLLDVVRRLADAERVGVRLALAEERLRFARDLHDVVGRDLSAIAVTSDLVAELARRGRPEAVDRAEEVRTIAQNSLQQIRDVVRGYRAVDLATELEGSVALLRSAGVECTVEHTESDLPVEVRSAAAWVIREGVTNVVRHSAATWCRITVSRSADELGVLLENDGVSSAATGNGSGLAGLAERLHPLGGRLDVRRGDGTFVLDARLEVPA
ncbi:sensor histidine kinase [Kineococcus sp. GCM10028916]|uniref:sensor histidine kinase n=1 Tax=Kineococcus sp. GCM10028916 TaxID=3273394 RepID=UPI00362A0723